MHRSNNMISTLHILVNCLWSVWEESDCSATCGAEAFRTRTRKVIREAENDGSCSGKRQEIESCNLDPCPKRKISYANQ